MTNKGTLLTDDEKALVINKLGYEDKCKRLEAFQAAYSYQAEIVDRLQSELAIELALYNLLDDGISITHDIIVECERWAEEFDTVTREEITAATCKYIKETTALHEEIMKTQASRLVKADEE
jgi:hypothetical protein